MGQRLITNHVDAGLGEGLRDRKVNIVWGNDGDEIDSLLRRQRQLAFQHLGPRAVVAPIVESEIPTGGDRLLRRRG